MTQLLQEPASEPQLDRVATPSFSFSVERDCGSDHPHDLYISLLSKRLEQFPHPDWLDVGCGWHCDWPWEPQREQSLMSKANAFGLDPDWQAIARHRTIHKRVVGTIEGLPYAAQSFDVVTANVVVEHLKHPALAFAEVFRVLRPGGLFLFRTPSARSYIVRIARLLPQSLKFWLASRVIERRKVEDIYPAHYRANTTEVLQEICRLVGFRRLRITVTSPRGAFSRFPRLNRIERMVANSFPSAEGALLVEVQK